MHWMKNIRKIFTHDYPISATDSGTLGPLMGGPHCRLSILRNGNVPCHYFLNVPVDFKIVQCHLSILRNNNVPCHYFSNVPVDLKVVQCRLSNVRKRLVALSILRVKGPYIPPINMEHQQSVSRTVCGSISL